MLLRLVVVVGLSSCSARTRMPPEVAEPVVRAPVVAYVFPAPDLSIPIEDRLVPIGGWIRIAGRVGWIFVDPETGPSLRWHGTPWPGRQRTYRLKWRPGRLERLTPQEITGAGLPSQPEWLGAFGRQPEAGTLWGEWRLDPLLAPVLDPEDPDLMPVWVHDGPREAVAGIAEQVWVRVTGCEVARCTGVLLTEPDAVESVVIGGVVNFGKEPVWEGEHVFLAPLQTR